MQIGKYSVDFLQQARMLVDGGVAFSGMPKEEWQELIIPDSRNRVELGINQLLIRSDSLCMLVDTGISPNLNPKKKQMMGIKARHLYHLLNEHGVTPDDVTHVVLSHLHYDHCGGSTITEGDSVVPAFRNAKYIVQADEWKAACHPDAISRSAYVAHDFLPLYESPHLQMINGDSVIVDGISLKVTGGHTAAHQMIYIESEAKKLIFPADICPTPLHISLERRDVFDLYPLDTMNSRKYFIKESVGENSFVFFSHSIKPVAYKIAESTDCFVATACHNEA